MKLQILGNIGFINREVDSDLDYSLAIDDDNKFYIEIDEKGYPIQSLPDEADDEFRTWLFYKVSRLIPEEKLIDVNLWINRQINRTDRKEQKRAAIAAAESATEDI